MLTQKDLPFLSCQESFEVHLREEKGKPPIANILGQHILDFVSFILPRDSTRDARIEPGKGRMHGRYSGTLVVLSPLKSGLERISSLISSLNNKTFLSVTPQ